MNLERRERRRQEKAAALARAPDIDLSGTEWPDLPHSEIVNAAIARARGFVQRYPDRHATSVRRLLADRHGLSPDQIALGNGAAELLHSAALALLSAGDELVTPWPSYPLYPLMAAHAGADPVPVDRSATPRRGQRPHEGRRHLQPERPDRVLPALVRAARPALLVLPDAGAPSSSTRRSSTSRTPRIVDCVPAAGRRVPAAARGAHLLEDLRPVRPARRLRGELGLAPAGRGGARAGHQRAHPGRGRVRAPKRRRGDRAPPPGGGPRAAGPDRPAARAGRGRDRQPGQLPLDPRPRHERRPAGERPPQAGRHRRPGRPAGRGQPHPRRDPDEAASNRLRSALENLL